MLVAICANLARDKETCDVKKGMKMARQMNQTEKAAASGGNHVSTESGVSKNASSINRC